MISTDDRALIGAAVAFRQLDRDSQRAVAAATRTTLRPLWRNVVATRQRVAQRRVSPRQDALTGAGTASVSAGGKGTLRAYTGRRALSGGMSADNWPWVEFGTLRAGYAGTRLPTYTPGGRIAFPAIKAWAPAAARVWLAVLLDTVRGTGTTGGA